VSTSTARGGRATEAEHIEDTTHNVFRIADKGLNVDVDAKYYLSEALHDNLHSRSRRFRETKHSAARHPGYADLQSLHLIGVVGSPLAPK